MVFWFKNGYFLFKELKNYIYYILKDQNYFEIKTPLFINYNFLTLSGHLEKFKNNIFEINFNNFYYIIKPLNCPNHILFFKNEFLNSTNFPIRFLEFGNCYRNEFSGGLFNLMRLREFTQDDGHIFCDLSDVIKEGVIFNKLLLIVYKNLNINFVNINLSLRPLSKLGSDFLWDISENKLRNILIICNVKWKEILHDGAFYGPKIEYHIKDNFNNNWQCGTFQLDLILPKLFNINIKSKKSIIIIHRAILGSLERFLGIIFSYFFYKKIFYFWLSPLQILIINLSIESLNYSLFLYNFLKNRKFRVIFKDKIDSNFNIYFNFNLVHYIIFVGLFESQNNLISVRSKNEFKFNTFLSLDLFLTILLRNYLLYF